ncbi:winged helix-turn-helix domain-containing protein [Vibrio hannami]|uniref:winged helix-turn-helix domain-containing protein n=1 Tax=Vibrio hannami TaxID=2717094 RepID=UPI00240FA57D|nr:winged helix-turn-helix domain-containing protein [Vibrio hannami]MDG3086377.1 winged helix-turn-helix domain-containing protein [Vibrio hannami]
MEFNISQRYIFNQSKSVLIDTASENAEIKLNSNHNRILHLLVENPKQVISRDELQDHVWRSQGIMVHDSSLTQAISTLRKALGDSTKNPQYIRTVPKRGYQLIADVVDLSPKPIIEESPEIVDVPAPIKDPKKRRNVGSTSIFFR